jgi:hypothetical protein
MKQTESRTAGSTEAKIRPLTHARYAICWVVCCVAVVGFQTQEAINKFGL